MAVFDAAGAQNSLGAAAPRLLNAAHEEGAREDGEPCRSTLSGIALDD